jgi:urease accessory protein
MGEARHLNISVLPQPFLPRALHSASAELELVVDGHGRTVLADVFHSQPLRLLFPQPPDGDILQAVLACVSGGILGGDRLRVRIRLGAGARAMVVGQAAEKIYRSLGEDSIIENMLEVGEGAWLEWLPQETILFDRSRLRRTTAVKLHAGGHLLGGDILVFGRAARGESLTQGLVHDGWEISATDDTLIWKDVMHLEGVRLMPQLQAPAGFGGARAWGTMIYAHTAARALLNGLRDFLRAYVSPGLRLGATMVRGLLLVRFLGQSAIELRAAYAAVWQFLRHQGQGLPAQMPSLWRV